MRLALGLLLIVMHSVGQDTATFRSSTTDVNGHTVAGPEITVHKTATQFERTERHQSINGRLVPLERTTERVIRDDPSGRVLERTVQRFDQDGRPTAPETALVEQENRPGGVTVVRTTTSRRDINGNVRISERSVTETYQSGQTETSQTVVERSRADGTLEPVEKKTAVKTESPEGFALNSATYRRGANGFYEAARVIADRKKDAAGTTDHTAEYEIGSTGALELHTQTARVIQKHSDGSETEVLDVFGQAVPGIAGTAGSPLKLKERETVERSIASNGSISETLSVRRPSVSDPDVLGPMKLLSEIVCTGKCHD